MTARALSNKEWRLERNGTTYLVSMNRQHLSHEYIQDSFATEDMYWAKRLPSEDLEAMLSASLSLGLYVATPVMPPPSTTSSPSSPRTPSPTLESSEQLEQIGFARFVTDHVSTLYLTDVYVSPQHRGDGLGKWLIACCREVIDSMPSVRRILLMASPGDGKRFYERELGMYDIEQEREHMICMTRRMF